MGDDTIEYGSCAGCKAAQARADEAMARAEAAYKLAEAAAGKAESALRQLHEDVSPVVNQHDDRLDDHDEKFDALNKSVGQVLSKVDRVERWATTLQPVMQSVDARLLRMMAHLKVPETT